jgi:hypothetical protein
LRHQQSYANRWSAMSAIVRTTDQNQTLRHVRDVPMGDMDHIDTMNEAAN